MQNRIIAFFTAAAVLVVLAGCGGGGGGDAADVSDSISQSESFYNGIKTKAYLDQTNLEEYASDSMLGYESANASTEVFRSKQQENIKNLTGVNSFFMAKDMIQKITGENSAARTTYQESGYENGTCGGTGYYSAYLDTDSGTFSIAVDFDDYCYWGLTYQGSLEFNGKFSGSELHWSNISTLSFEYDRFRLYNYTRDMEANGAIVFKIFSGYSSMTADITMYDKNQNKYIRFSDLICTIYDNPGYTQYNGYSYYYSSQISLIGKVYISDYGYVEITTPDRVDVSSGGYYLDGTIKMEGNDNTSILLEYTPYSSQTVTGDLDGDNVYETVY